jgi:beta-ureidopropionase / N-carbamoyl-L-amino-acid hydrolase
MDEAIVRKLAAACERMGVPPELTPSGAGHDAAAIANEGVPSGMVFVRNENGSHNPNEAMDFDDFLKGVGLVLATVSEGL